tara:strand:+ start:12767 stop:14512 length:1746 start_codon:yes stop_codon:yes gene_type:complete
MDSIKKILFLIPKNLHLKTTLIFIFFFVNAFLELLGIGLILPVISILSDGQSTFYNINFEKYFSDLVFFNNLDFKYIVLILLLFVFTIKIIFSLFLNWYQSTFLTEINTKISSNLFKNYIYNEYLFFVRKNTSEIIRNIINETNLYIKKSLVPFLINIMDFLILLGIFVLIFSVDFKSSLMIMVVYFVLGFVYLTSLKRKLYNIGLEQLNEEKLKLNSAVEPLIGIKTVKIFLKEHDFVSKYIFHLNKVANLNRIQSFLQNIPAQIVELVTVYVFVLLVISMLNEYENFKNVIPKLALLTAAAFRVMPSTKRIILNTQLLKSGSASLENLYREVKKYGFKDIKKDTKDKFVFKHKIEIKNLSFSHLNLQNNKKQKILKNLSLTIHKGESVGIIGKTGEGKTTLIDIILGIIKSEKGKILIDGQNLKNIKKKWIKSIGYVAQETFLIRGDLKKNITLQEDSEEIDKKHLKKIVEISEINRFFKNKKNFKKNMSTLISERGLNMSGGQKQRIGIARALYKNPDLLILDEPTSALDKITEKKIINNIFRLKEDKTIIIISHRNATLAKCDKIYKLVNLKLVKIK